MRRGHRCPAEHSVIIVWQRAENALAGRAHQDRVRPEIREAGERVSAGRGCYRNHVWQRITGWIMRMNIAVSRLVSGCGDEENSGLGQGIDGVCRRLGIPAATVARVDYANVRSFGMDRAGPEITHLLHVVVGLDRIGISAGVGSLRNES